MRVATVFFLIGFLAPVARGQVSSAEYQEIVKEFKRLYTVETVDSKVEALQLLGRADDLRTTKMLWSLLLKHQGTKWKDRQLFEGCVSALRYLASEKPLDYVFDKLGSRLKPARRADVCLALAKVKHPMVVERLSKLARHSSPLVSIPALDALGHCRSEKAIPALVHGLKDQDHWQVRYAALMGCVRHRAKPAVPIIIKQMASDTSRMQHDYLRALQAMTRAEHRSIKAWQDWWEANKDHPRLVGGGMSVYRKLRGSRVLTGEAPRGGAEPQDGTSEVKMPNYYGIELTASRNVFVIDMSLSMLDPYKGKRPDAGQFSIVISGSKDDPAKRKRLTLDFSKIKTNWDLAREQLIFTLRMLDSSTMFTIILYNSKVKYWKRNLVAASPEAVDQAISYLRKIKPDEETNMFEALEKAFLAGGSGNDPLSARMLKDGVDAIFFLSDGAPTVGKYVYERSANILERTWDKKLLAAIDDWNRIRKVQINTVGMGDTSESLMGGLARSSDGKYVTPGFNEDGN